MFSVKFCLKSVIQCSRWGCVVHCLPMSLPWFNFVPCAHNHIITHFWIRYFHCLAEFFMVCRIFDRFQGPKHLLLRGHFIVGCSNVYLFVGTMVNLVVGFFNLSIGQIGPQLCNHLLEFGVRHIQKRVHCLLSCFLRFFELLICLNLYKLNPAVLGLAFRCIVGGHGVALSMTGRAQTLFGNAHFNHFFHHCFCPCFRKALI